MKKSAKANQTKAPETKAEPTSGAKSPIDFSRRNANRSLDVENRLEKTP